MPEQKTSVLRATSITCLCILAATFFVMLIVMLFCQSAINVIDTSERTRLLISTAVQGVLVFAIPAIVSVYAASNKPVEFLGVGKIPQWKVFVGILIVFAIGLPALNQLIYWNQTFSFPESLSGLEEKLRKMEESATDTSAIILDTHSLTGLLWGILIIGCVTGLCEELFFRGSMQTILRRGNLPAGTAIWITAIVFSTLHFQFFGFFPRVVLGAFFGYLLVWTGSLWTSVFAHAFNNSLVVITAWLMQTGICTESIDSIGISKSGIPWIALLSLFATIAFFIYCRKYFFYTDKRNM